MAHVTDISRCYVVRRPGYGSRVAVSAGHMIARLLGHNRQIDHIGRGDRGFGIAFNKDAGHQFFTFRRTIRSVLLQGMGRQRNSGGRRSLALPKEWRDSHNDTRGHAQQGQGKGLGQAEAQE